MRILLVTEPSGGGSGRHVVDLAGGLCSLGHEVSVIYSSSRVEPRFLSELAELPTRAMVDVTMKRAVGPWDLSAARRLSQKVRELGPFDVVHAHSSKAGALLRLIAPAGAARVYTPHAFRTMDPTMGAIGRWIYGGVERFLTEFFTDAIIAVAPEEAEHARQLGISDEKLHVVVNGVTPSPPVDRETARSELGASATDIVLGFVGRLCEQKDPVRFAKAVQLARRDSNEIRGVILGDGELLAQTKVAGGEGVEVYSGLDARRYLPAFDIFVMTSRYEAMPYVLLEALQAGLPIIATRVGGTSVAVVAGENGVVVPTDASSETFADALLTLVPLTERARMADQSRVLAEKFSLDTMVDATEAVYSAAISRRLRCARACRLPFSAPETLNAAQSDAAR